MDVQSIRVAKTVTQLQAKQIVKKLGFKVSVKPNPQYANYHSFRQKQPNAFVKNSFRIKFIKSNPKIMLVVGKLKK